MADTARTVSTTRLGLTVNDARMSTTDTQNRITASRVNVTLSVRKRLVLNMPVK